MALLGSDHGAAVHSPFLAPSYFDALARAGGRWGWGGRTETMRALFGDVVPEALISRRGKAEFSEPMFSNHTRRFARRWDGQSGIDPALVDGAALRRIWTGPRDALRLGDGAPGGVAGRRAGRLRWASSRLRASRRPGRTVSGAGDLSRRLPARLSSLDKGRLAIEIVADYARVMWLLRRDALPTAIAALRAGPPATRCAAAAEDALGDGRRLGRAVVRTLAPLPRGSRCLTRSLVLMSLLARRGVAVDLVIAVQPSADPSLDAHAWVEVDGAPLLAPASDYGRLVTL